MTLKKHILISKMSLLLEKNSVQRLEIATLQLPEPTHSSVYLQPIPPSILERIVLVHLRKTSSTFSPVKALVSRNDSSIGGRSGRGAVKFQLTAQKSEKSEAISDFSFYTATKFNHEAQLWNLNYFPALSSPLSPQPYFPLHLIETQHSSNKSSQLRTYGYLVVMVTTKE